jgi:hypothetical protein
MQFLKLSTSMSMRLFFALAPDSLDTLYNFPKKQDQLGNWNIQIAGHILLWFLFGFFVSVIANGINLKKSAFLANRKD